MKINILQMIEGAKQAEGLTVIIDVFRAFSTACYVFDNGVEKIIPVGKLDTAYKLKEENADLVLMGERAGKTLAGFDYGNSPALIKDVDFSNKIVVHTTSAGTQGIVNAKNAAEIITGSFVNASAIVKYIAKKKPSQVTLVCMGNAGIESADEDLLCAIYIKNLLKQELLSISGSENGFVDDKDISLLREIFIEQSNMINLEESLLESLEKGEIEPLIEREVVVKILRNGSGKRFFEPANMEWSPVGDFEMCLNFNIFDFVLKAEKYDDNLFYLKKMDVN